MEVVEGVCVSIFADAMRNDFLTAGRSVFWHNSHNWAKDVVSIVVVGGGQNSAVRGHRRGRTLKREIQVTRMGA